MISMNKLQDNGIAQRLLGGSRNNDDDSVNSPKD